MEAKNRNNIWVFSFIWLILISLIAVSLGIKLSGESGYTVIFNTIEYESIKDLIMSVSIECAVDIAMFFLVTISARPIMTVASASMILVLRGLTLGACAKFCAENAIDSVTVIMMISYAMVSAALLLYAVVINRINISAKLRFVMYLLVTGTAVALRAFTMLLA